MKEGKAQVYARIIAEQAADMGEAIAQQIEARFPKGMPDSEEAVDALADAILRGLSSALSKLSDETLNRYGIKPSVRFDTTLDLETESKTVQRRETPVAGAPPIERFLAMLGSRQELRGVIDEIEAGLGETLAEYMNNQSGGNTVRKDERAFLQSKLGVTEEQVSKYCPAEQDATESAKRLVRGFRDSGTSLDSALSIATALKKGGAVTFDEDDMTKLIHSVYSET